MAVIVDVFAARSDNFGYLVHDTATGRTAAIDAPEAAAIKTALLHRGWTLTDIFITHHHIDHVEGHSPSSRPSSAPASSGRAPRPTRLPGSTCWWPAARR